MVCVMKSHKVVTKAAKKGLLALYAVCMTTLDSHHVQVSSVAFFFCGSLSIPAHLFEYICQGSQGSCHIGAFSTIGLLPDVQCPPTQGLRLTGLPKSPAPHTPHNPSQHSTLAQHSAHEAGCQISDSEVQGRGRQAVKGRQSDVTNYMRQVLPR